MTILKSSFLLASAMVVFSSAANATVILTETFNGTSSMNLSGRSTTTGGKTWTATDSFKANGTYSTLSNLDLGASVDLGALFFGDQFAVGNNKIVLTATYGTTGNSNSRAYVGFSTDEWIAAVTGATTSEFNVGARAQGQGLTLNIDYDTINSTFGLHRDTTSGDGNTDTRDSIAAGTSARRNYTMTITAGASGYTNSTVSVSDGTDSSSITGYDASGLRTLYIGVEVINGGGSANYDSIALNAIPEPSTTALGLIGMLALVRRRR